MAFSFDDLREKVTDLAQSGVAKSKQLAEIAKLKTSNMGEEDTIKKAYLELGRLYYAERGAAPEGAYAAACGRRIKLLGRAIAQADGKVCAYVEPHFVGQIGRASCRERV